MEEIKLKDITVIDSNTAEVITVEKAVELYMKENNKSIKNNKKTIEKIQQEYIDSPNKLTNEDIVRLAKHVNLPIASMKNFYSLERRASTTMLELPKGAMELLLKLMKMVSLGGIVKSFTNGKPIRDMESLYENLGIERRKFYKAKNEIEDLRIVKFLKIDNKIYILFDPTFLRFGIVDKLVFDEFKEEFKKYNDLDYLYHCNKYKYM